MGPRDPGRTWTWSPSMDPGWPGKVWVTETLDEADARWFARISDNGNRSVRPVVLVHGLIVSGSYFRPVAQFLDDHMRLYIPDLPGFGRSVSRSGVWSLERLAVGLAHWMDVHDLKDAMLVSNSLGCQVLTLMATIRPDLVHSLVLVAPTMDSRAASILRLLVRGATDVPRESSTLWRVWLYDFARAGPRRGLRTLHMGIVDRQEDRLSNVSASVLVIGGERDPIVSADWVMAMAQLFPAGRAIIIPNAPHAMNYSNPRQLARLIRVAAHGFEEESMASGQ